MFDDILGPRNNDFKKKMSDKEIADEINNLKMESKANAGVGAKKPEPIKAIDPGDPWGKDDDEEEKIELPDEDCEYDEDGKECTCDKGEDEACDGCGCLASDNIVFSDLNDIN